VVLEDAIDRHLLAFLDQRIGVYELSTETSRDPPAHGGLPDRHETGEDDVRHTTAANRRRIS
jgi:hypothetical protein